MLKKNACALRPMREADLKTVLEWRNSERVRSVSLDSRMISWDEHRAWFARRALDRLPLSYVFEIAGAPAGVVNFVREETSFTWSFYLGGRDNPPGAALAMMALGLDVAFTALGACEVKGVVVADNRLSAKLHRRLGFTGQTGSRTEKRRYSLIFQLSKADWERKRTDIGHYCFSEERH